MFAHADGVGDHGDAARARLYERLPLLENDRWWLDRAVEAPGARVLELGAGGGRLARAMAAAGADVTAVERDPAMAAQLREQVALADGHVEVVEADAARWSPDLTGGFGLVVLAASLLNELGDARARRDVLATARRACRRDGLVALQVLGPWWLEAMPACSTGELLPMAGGPSVIVDIERCGRSTSTGRRQARLTYRFPDGEVLGDALDADVLSTVEVDLLLEEAGLEVIGRWGAHPPEPISETDPVRYVLARPR